MGVKEGAILQVSLRIAYFIFLGIFAAAVMIQGWDLTATNAIIAATPIFASIVALRGVIRTLESSNAQEWWHRTEWIVDRLIEARNRREFWPMSEILAAHLNSSIPDEEERKLINNIIKSLLLD
ncbi:hypothetical protein [Corynebacterium pseudogenitalium]|uniref:DUF4231 domain-containing protein n=1 Tax=Corynebacterium pseudogenitalium TaxID=38303 RepID=A0ABD4TRQ7_9CORY|nr:hypothetical protein [Corynebacterium pseudogenitalium]MCQ4614989.1 hypothetical protein [Corynebacterium pseudogenitalium]